MYNFVATALADLPVAENAMLEVMGEQARLRIVPLPFNTLEGLSELPEWYADLVEADAILIRSGIIDRWLIDRLTVCKVITLHGVGVDQVDVAYCTQKGITVTNIPAGNAIAAAELAVGLMLDALRGISRADALIKSGQWDAGRQIGHELGSQRVGIIGLGNIGRRVADIVSAFGADVRYYDAYNSSDSTYRYLDCDELLKWASIVTVHVPLNDETRDLIGKKELMLLGPDGILINVARGAIVNQEALTEALHSATIRWAGCDVFSTEPPNLNDDLFKQANTSFTPHIGGSTYECLDAIASRAAADMLRVCEGQKPLHPVN